MILQCIFPIFFNRLSDFGGRRGLDKNFAANSGLGAAKWLRAGVLRSLERRDVENQRKGKGNSLDAEFAEEKRKGRGGRTGNGTNERNVRNVCAMGAMWWVVSLGCGGGR
jgi:hypothetical protein